FLRGGFLVHRRRTLPCEQPRYKLRAILRHFKQRLVEQEFEHVLAPDVQDECHPGLKRRDVREVLVGGHTDIHTTRRRVGFHLRDDVLVLVFIRDEVLKWKVAVGLRKIRYDPPEFRIRQLRRQRVGGLRSQRVVSQKQREQNQHRAGPNRAV